MKYTHSFFLLLAAFILQSTVMNYLSIFGVTPNLILCLVIILSFLYEGYHGIVFGIIFGLIVDISFSEIIGVAAICNVVVALLCREMKRVLYKDSVVSVIIITVLSTVCYGWTYWGVLRILGIYFNYVYVLKIQGISILYNGIIAMILYLIMSRKVIKHRSDRYMYRNSLQEARSLYKS